jgi:hypothetical protein
MKHATVIALLVLAALAAAVVTPAARAHVTALSNPVIDPAPKWQYKGCTSWCQTGWYASPAVADLNGDGQVEVIWSPYSIYVVVSAGR